MRIACIGWGSLVWKPESLHCFGQWQTDGPTLPIEFARTSRDGRLTLVLTPNVPPVPTLWIELDYATADSAREALASRESCDPQAIGLWPGPAPRYAVGAGEVSAWAQAKGLDAVVWTALRPKFGGMSGKAPESAEVAVAYLKGLSPDAVSASREYVERAPVQVRTPFRSVFEAQLGWRSPGEPTT